MHHAAYDDINPDTIVLSTVSVCARSGNRDAESRAYPYLAYMQKVEAVGHKDRGPDERTYETVIGAWSNSGHPIANCEIAALQEEMKCLAAKGRLSRK
jgi:hypothetical protein